MRHHPRANSIFLQDLIVAVLFSIFVLSTPVLADQLSIQCPAGTPFVRVGDTSRQQVTASGGNGSPYSFFIVSTQEEDIEIDQSSGLVTYVGAWIGYSPSCTIVGVTDGVDTAMCTVCWWILSGTSFKATIEFVHNVSLGGTADVRLFLTRADTYRGLGGFDLLVALEPSALSFMSATPGSVYDSCGWEYFSYRLQEPCTGCPSGLVHLYGLAESNPLTPHPTCGWPAFNAHMPVTLATLKVRVAIDRDYGCALVPIRFYWTGCSDNAIWTNDRKYTTLASKIYDYGNPNEIQDPQAGFPGFVGPLYDCNFFSDTAEISRDLELQNGGLDILCVDPIGQRGDINVNGYPYEIADAVMFSEYFIDGFAAFGTHLEASMAASDVNGDGETLKLPDLVYLVRVVLGDIPPIPKPVANYTATVASENGVIAVTNSPGLGAVLLTLRGNPDVTLLQANLRMSRHFDGEFTKVLLTIPFESIDAGAGFSGKLLQADGAEVISAELVDFDGRTVKTTINAPSGFVYEPMYPNPFNPSSMFSFSSPVESDYCLSVFNMIGQKALNFGGHVMPNQYVSLNIDMHDKSSGIYLFKFTAGEFSLNWKGILLK